MVEAGHLSRKSTALGGYFSFLLLKQLITDIRERFSTKKCL